LTIIRGCIGYGGVQAVDGAKTLGDGLNQAFNEASESGEASAISTAPMYSGDLVKVNKPDPAADALAERIGGESRVHFESDGREFDVISDAYVARSKPAGFRMGSQFRNQAKATFEAALQTGRTPYFHFEGPPESDVIGKLQSYGQRCGISPVIDTAPLG
jgi:hypothetical protein